MTAQINDTFRYHCNQYAVAGISEGELFRPDSLDLAPAPATTACWRGYQARFAISGSHLVLDALHVNLVEDFKSGRRKEGPVINGVEPTASHERYGFLNNHYLGLDLRLKYSGGLLLADGFIRELYVHMGFHPAWKYETVIELVFEDGILRSEADRSESAAGLRQRILESRGDEEAGRMPDRDEIREFVKLAFDRTYRM